MIMIFLKNYKTLQDDSDEMIPPRGAAPNEPGEVENSKKLT